MNDIAIRVENLSIFNDVLSVLLGIEERWLTRHGKLLWGTSIVVVARRGR